MLEWFYIPSNEIKLFTQFVLDRDLCDGDDFKILIPTVATTKSIYTQGKLGYLIKYCDYTVVFRDKETCQMVEMFWLMMKDEYKDKRGNVALAA